MAQTPPTMDRDEMVKIISDFYTFLTTHPFIPESAIKTPPPEGWSEENRQTFRRLGKSEEVVDLLSYLPFIDDASWEWFHDTKPINYISPLNLRRMDNNYESKRYLFEPQDLELPAHVVSLTNGRLYGIWLLLDTQAGTITEYSVFSGPQPMIPEEHTKAMIWRLFPTHSVKEFFTACKKRMQDKRAQVA